VAEIEILFITEQTAVLIPHPGSQFVKCFGLIIKMRLEPFRISRPVAICTVFVSNVARTAQFDYMHVLHAPLPRHGLQGRLIESRLPADGQLADVDEQSHSTPIENAEQFCPRKRLVPNRHEFNHKSISHSCQIVAPLARAIALF